MRSVCSLCLAAASVIAFLGACDPEPDPDDPGHESPGGESDDTPRIELAASTPDGLTDMIDGSTVQLVMGPQGGYHIDVGVRIFGLDPEGAHLRYEVWTTDHSRAFHADATYAIRRDRLDTVDDHYERPRDRAFLDITDPSDIAGRTVDILALLTPPGYTDTPPGYTDVRTVTISPPPHER